MSSVPTNKPGVYGSRALSTAYASYVRSNSTKGSHSRIPPFSSNAFRPSITRPRLHRHPGPSIGASRWVRPYTNSQNNYGYSSATPDNTKFIWIIIGANAAVFLAWQYVFMNNRPKVVSTPSGLRRSGPPPSPGLYNILQKYFILRVNDVRDGNYLSSLGSAFSHTGTTHFIGNMISMFAFGSTVGAVPGIRIAHLAQLVFGSALCGSAGFMLFGSRQGPQARNKAALGASGVVMGLGAAAFALVPRTRFLIYGIIPIRLWLLVPGYFAMDAYYLDDPNSRVAHSGHLGGAAFGLLFCALRFRGVGGIFGR